MAYRRVLVTGGTGLLGSAFGELSDPTCDRTFLLCGSRDADLRDPRATLRLFEHHRPDAVIHLAAVSGGVQFSRAHPASLLRDNVLMNFSVLEAARAAGVAKVLVTLSTGMYAPDVPLPIREDDIHVGPPHESNYGYAFAKRLLDPSVRAYRDEYGMSVIGVAINGLFGERGNFRPHESIMVAALIRRFYEQRDDGSPIVVWGDGTPLREYTYAPDAARAALWCLDHYDDPQFLHIGSMEELSVRDIAWSIADLLAIDRARIVFDETKPGGVHRKNTDNSRFLALSGFTYTPFHEGLRRTIEWFSSNYAVPGHVKL